jgi:predicted nucleotidyltransferase
MKALKMLSIPSGVVSLRLFGSVARSDSDSLSDLDILGVVESSFERRVTLKIEEDVERMFQRRASFSWYGKNRLKEMFTSGHLFAWHLYLESIPLIRAKSNDMIDTMGCPAVYNEAEADIEALIDILGTIPGAVTKCPANAAYEAGVTFVCLRNIALSVSWYSATGLDFSRYSPYGIEKNLEIPFPLNRNEYELLVMSRLSGKRGNCKTNIDDDTLLSFYPKVEEWATTIYEFVKRRR